MNDPTDNLHAPLGAPDAGGAADELLGHGLLTFARHDGPGATERRVRAVMHAIAGEAAVHAPGREPRRLLFPHARRWAALAACVAVVAGMVYLGMPTESKAQAMVRTIAASLREPGERRFEVRIQARGSTELEPAPMGMIDTRGADEMVARLAPEEGVWLTIGRDAEGTWIVHPDGRTERNPPPGMLPRWGMVDGQGVTPESVDRVLEHLANNYTLERTSEHDASGSGGALDHIWGRRRPDADPCPPRVDLWLDPQTHAIRKVELMFPDPPPPLPPPPGPEGRSGERRDGPGRPDRAGGRPPRGREGLWEGLNGAIDGPRNGDGPPPIHPPRGPGRDGEGPRGGRPGREGPRYLRGGPVRIELRPAPPPPPLPPDWFRPEGHARGA